MDDLGVGGRSALPRSALPRSARPGSVAMAPPSWKECPHCKQKFSPASLNIHVKRCRDHKEVQRENEAIREARYMQNAFWHRPALPSWQPCPNCLRRTLATHANRFCLASRCSSRMTALETTSSSATPTRTALTNHSRA